MRLAEQASCGRATATKHQSEQSLHGTLSRIFLDLCSSLVLYNSDVLITLPDADRLSSHETLHERQ